MKVWWCGVVVLLWCYGGVEVWGGGEVVWVVWLCGGVNVWDVKVWVCVEVEWLCGGV